MTAFLTGFLGAVALSILAPDQFATVSKFVRALPGKAVSYLTGVK